MTSTTTIRIDLRQRDVLRRLAHERGETLTATLDAALDALRREDFFNAMARAEAELRADPAAWGDYQDEARAWGDVP